MSFDVQNFPGLAQASIYFLYLLSIVFLVKVVYFVNNTPLCRFLCENEMKRVREQLENVKEEIIKVAPLTPEGNKSLIWPLGNEIFITKLSYSLLWYSLAVRETAPDVC